MTECNCGAPPNGEHWVTCPTYQPPLTYEELLKVRLLLTRVELL